MLLAADGIQLLSKVRQMAAEFRYDHGYEIPVHYLAKKIADENQVSGFPPAAAPTTIVGLLHVL